MGQKNILTLYANDSQLMNDAIDRVVVEIYNRRKDKSVAQSLILTGCGPQCGTTSTCISMGIAFANAKWRTLIIDCDIRKAYNFKKLNQQVDKGLEDYLLSDETSGEIKIDDIICSTNIDNLYYVSCGQYAEKPTRLFCSEKMQKVHEYVNENYDFVLFDCPSITIVPDAQILFNYVDGIILLSALNVTTKKQIREAKLKMKRFEDKYYGMIVNKVELPLYKKYVKNYDYYFYNKKGIQKLDNNAARKYSRKAAKEGKK